MLTVVLGSVEATLRLARTCKCSRFFCIDAGAELVLLPIFFYQNVYLVLLCPWEKDDVCSHAELFQKVAAAYCLYNTDCW